MPAIVYKNMLYVAVLLMYLNSELGYAFFFMNLKRLDGSKS